MHELSLSRAVVDTVVAHAAGRRVTAVTLRVGRFRQVVPETLAFYFALMAGGTVCEGAHLEQELVPALARCPACRNEWELSEPTLRCARCGAGAGLMTGEELEVESIEVEEAGCIAPR